ncbi:MAG TPA: XrtA-associated tyrosine autokinase [Geobacteraceae bacterium]|nr:XrtA-associated tyrosine autokinase [Geobacteraceae bacterium]
MSRIEDAMEKAEQLRQRDMGSVLNVELKPKQAPLPKPVPPSTKIEITNPLLLAANDFDLPVAEEYRKLKSAIVYATKKEGFLNTIMVTSAISGEGKSLTALNLAISLAQEHDHTVLLVDADLRSPFICEYLGIAAKKGLSDCLREGFPISDVLIKTGLGNLTIFPAGERVTNPVEFFSSQKMKDLLSEVKHRYADRYIIFDMPPILPFAETRLLGSIVDGVVFVVKEGGTSLHNIKEALDSLKDANILGLVYNEATEASLDNGYHYYYGKYRYGTERTAPTRNEKGRKRGILSRIRGKKVDQGPKT